MLSHVTQTVPHSASCSGSHCGQRSSDVASGTSGEWCTPALNKAVRSPHRRRQSPGASVPSEDFQKLCGYSLIGPQKMLRWASSQDQSALRIMMRRRSNTIQSPVGSHDIACVKSQIIVCRDQTQVEQSCRQTGLHHDNRFSAETFLTYQHRHMSGMSGTNQEIRDRQILCERNSIRGSDSAGLADYDRSQCRSIAQEFVWQWLQ